LLLGLAHLQFPFKGDQALFSLVSRMLDDGALLYEDIWDLKQPGIYWFFLSAGRLFSFSELGAHLLELIYLLAFAGFAWWCLRDRYETPWVAALIPAATVGWFYAATQFNYLTQVEALVGPLLFVSVWLLWTGGRLRILAAGLVGGVVLYLKFIFAPLLLGLWITAVLNSAELRRRLLATTSLLASGLALAAIPGAIWVFSNDLFDRVWWTYVTYPLEVDVSDRTMRRLVLHVGQFGVLYLPLILLAMRGIWVRRRDPFVRIWTVWIALGLLTYLQQFWWGYALQMMVVPIALLALEGFDDLITRRDRHYRLWVIGLAIAALPTLVVVGDKIYDLASNDLGIGDEARAAYQSAAFPHYGDIAGDIDHLAGDDDPFYVLGDPIYFVLADRPQAPAVNGWSPEYWTDDLWEEFREGLAEDKPTFLLIEEANLELLAKRPEALAVVEQEYEVFRPSRVNGTWYVHRAASQG
nr:hypothetical protein [Acidimicrobiia bacterium]